MPVGGDQHIARLQIAMHDQRVMRGLHGATDLREQAQSLRHAQAPGAHVVVDATALDQFQGDEGLPLRADVAFDQARDVGVLQLRQRQTLAIELLARNGAMHAAVQELQRHVLGHAVKLATRAVDRGRTAFAQDLEQFERADARADRDFAARVDALECVGQRIGAADAEAGSGFVLRGEHTPQPIAHRGIVAVCLQEGVVLMRGKGGGLFEQAPQQARCLLRR